MKALDDILKCISEKHVYHLQHCKLAWYAYSARHHVLMLAVLRGAASANGVLTRCASLSRLAHVPCHSTCRLFLSPTLPCRACCCM